MSVTNPSVSIKARKYLSPKEAAESIPGLTIAKLSQLRFTASGPRYYKPTPKTVVYAEDDLITWLESTARTGTAEAN